MAAVSSLYRAHRIIPPLLVSTRIISSSRICLPSVSRKCTSCVVYLSPSSNYHTEARVRHRLLTKNNLTQFSARPIHRNSSYFTSLLNKAFVVSAAEPIPESEVHYESEVHHSEVFSRTVADSSPISEPILETSHEFTTTSEAAIDSIVYTPPPPTLDDISYIPPPPAPDGISYIPPPPEPLEAVAQPLNALGEPTLQSLGLGGWSPVGLIQNSLDFLHVSLDLPWWGAIAVATVCIRMMIFPLVLMSQRNAAKMHNNLPQLQVLQMKMSEARQSGNQMEAARLAQEMAIFMKEKELNPLRNIIVPLAQAPLFISMFIGLRGMANLPLESMKDGGLFWFVDLTLTDPLYLLPLITASTMLATIELGTDGARLSSANMQNIKWILRALPFFVFPFTINFPTAVLCYWVSTNLFSLVQVGVLKIPTVRDYFQIPRMLNHNPDTLPQKKKGMVAGFKDSWTNMKITKELEERERYDEMRFKRAGYGPVVRTFKHDPTKRNVIDVKAKVKR